MIMPAVARAAEKLLHSKICKKALLGLLFVLWNSSLKLWFCEGSDISIRVIGNWLEKCVFICKTLKPVQISGITLMKGQTSIRRLIASIMATYRKCSCDQTELISSNPAQQLNLRWGRPIDCAYLPYFLFFHAPTSLLIAWLLCFTWWLLRAINILVRD